MKNQRTIILIVLIFYSSLTFGQANKVDIGFEVGPSLRFLYGNDVLKNNELSIGYSGGLTFQYSFSKLISLRTNISFERKGFSTNAEATDFSGNPVGELAFHSNFDYLIIPFLTRFTFGKKNYFFVNAGPYLGHLLKQKMISEAFKEYPRTETDNTDDFKKFDFGLTTGLGVNYPIQEKLLLTAEIRNNFGLINISSLPVLNDRSIKNNTTNLLMGIAYRLGNNE